MSTVYQQFTNDIAITITLASLANGSGATSSTINNSANKFISANVQLKIETGTGTSATGTLTVYLLRSADGGTTFDQLNANAEVMGVFNANADSTSYIFSIDTSIVGSLPDYWQLGIINNSGASFNAVVGNFSAVMVGKTLLIQ